LLRAKGFIYAYLSLGLPVLLFLLDGWEHQGCLITVTDYRLAATSVLPTKDLSQSCDALDRLYAHDNRMGSFARYSFTETGQLLTPWPAADD
jgi:hypothetical protein